MTAAIVNRVKHADEMGRACCRHLRANDDALATAGKVIEAIGLPVKVRAVMTPRLEERMGLPIVRYSFAVAVLGREWRGSGAAQDAELLNPANWRMDG